MRRTLARAIAAIVVITLAPHSARADWPEAGVLAGCFPDDVLTVQLYPDGSGGALYIGRVQHPEVWLQNQFLGRISASGSLTPWPGSVEGTPGYMDATPGGAGGAFRTRVISGGKLRVELLLSDGSLPAPWPAALDTLLSIPPAERLVADEAGGVFVAYNRNRTSGPTPREAVILTRLDASGQTVSGWPAAGLVLQTRATAYEPALHTDGAGGVYVAWCDGPYTGMPPDQVRVKHVLSDGTPDPAWPAAGISAPGVERALHVLPSGGGWIVITRTVATNPTEIRARRFTADGQWDPAWPSPLTLLSGAGFTKQLAFADNDGGFYAFLQHGAPGDVIGTHVHADGTPASGWALPELPCWEEPF